MEEEEKISTEDEKPPSDGPPSGVTNATELPAQPESVPPGAHLKRPTKASMPTETALAEVEKLVGYTFKNRQHLSAALIHSSAKENGFASNERMEFLGDSVIGMVVSELLYQRLPDAQEGVLSAIKSVVVSSSSLGAICKALGLAEHIVLGRGIAKKKPLPGSVLANVMESIASAVYLDGGLAAASDFICRALGPSIEDVIADKYEKNYKSLLQQYSQRELGCIPRYKVLRESGPDHEKEFEAMVGLGDKEYGPGRGKTKKEAEQQAARVTLIGLDASDERPHGAAKPQPNSERNS